MGTLLKLNHVSIDFKTEHGSLRAVQDVSLEIGTSEIVCLVGESGSGKTVTSLSIMRLTDYEQATIASGELLFDGKNLAAVPQKEMDALRGKRIGMIFQNPMNALDPLFTIESQLVDVLMTHTKSTKPEARRKALELLQKVGITEPEMRLKQYPFELSGGMLQRVMIAIALSCEPELLIADEPTTALDVTIQMQILQLIRQLKDSLGMSVLLITHDFGVAVEMADRIAVMYAGKIVEQGPARKLITAPEHPYTQGLIRSVQSYHSHSGGLYTVQGSIPPLNALPGGCRFHPRCEHASERCKREEPKLFHSDNGHQVACWHTDEAEQSFAQYRAETAGTPPIAQLAEPPAKEELLVDLRHVTKIFPIRGPLIKRKRKAVHAVDDVSLQIYRRETLGLVGESGCGKTTLGRLLVQLEEPTSGTIAFDGQSIASLSGREWKQLRHRMQVVFQDPAGSMNPRWRVSEVIAEPLRTHTDSNAQDRLALVKETMKLVGLNPEWHTKYPHEFSGGQLQRICIARAIILKPSFILLDEAVSALDISVQSQIVNLLKDLQRELGLTYLFIAHGLDVVRYISDRIGVMYLGKLMEIAPAEELFRRPAHYYSKMLLDANPSIDPEHRARETATDIELPSPVHLPSGCRFHNRCPAATERCRTEQPELRQIRDQHYAACHYPMDSNV